MASMDQAVTKLANLRFQRNYLWDVQLPGDILQGLLSPDPIEQLVQSVQFGDYTIESPVTMRIGTYQAYFASILTVDRVQLTFLKSIPDIVSDYFNAWKLLIVDKDGLFLPKNSYQRNVSIRFLDMDGTPFGVYKLIGAFPVQFPKYQELSYDQNSLTKVTIALQCDKIEYDSNPNDD
jgi:hypothetical protein